MHLISICGLNDSKNLKISLNEMEQLGPQTNISSAKIMIFETQQAR